MEKPLLPRCSAALWQNPPWNQHTNRKCIRDHQSSGKVQSLSYTALVMLLSLRELQNVCVPDEPSPSTADLGKKKPWHTKTHSQQQSDPAQDKQSDNIIWGAELTERSAAGVAVFRDRRCHYHLKSVTQYLAVFSVTDGETRLWERKQMGALKKAEWSKAWIMHVVSHISQGRVSHGLG